MSNINGRTSRIVTRCLTCGTRFIGNQIGGVPQRAKDHICPVMAALSTKELIERASAGKAGKETTVEEEVVVSMTENELSHLKCLVESAVDNIEFMVTDEDDARELRALRVIYDKLCGKAQIIDEPIAGFEGVA